MILPARIKLFCIPGFAVLFFSLSVIVFGQKCGDITVNCIRSELSCNYPTATCHPVSAELLEENEDKFDADYASKVTGREVTPDKLKSDAALQKGLKEGKYQRPDGKTVTFTPIDEVKRKIRRLNVSGNPFTEPIEIERSRLENRFNKISQASSLDEAIAHYRKLLENSLVKTPPTDFFQKLGQTFINNRNYGDAIKVLELNAEINRNSINAFFMLAEGYEKSYNANANQRHKENAIANYQKVAKNTDASFELRGKAIERLEKLRRRF